MVRWIWLMLTTVAVMVYDGTSLQNETNVYIDGDVTIGALFPIHRSIKGGCGDINSQDGIERLVAAMFALDIVNDKLKKEAGFRLGMLAQDTCYSNDRALEESLRFAQSRLRDGTTSANFDQCYGLLNVTVGNPVNNIFGVIGPSTSEESIQVATLLKLFKLPQISYFATSPELSDNDVLPYFLRTVPSDFFQIQVILSILAQLKWSYFSMIYEDSNYGENGAKVIEEGLKGTGYCLGLAHRVSKKDSTKHLQSLVTEILMRNNTHGETIIVLYVSYDLAIKVLRLIGKNGDTDNVRLIGVDAWIGRVMPDDKLVQKAADGAFGVTLKTMSMPGFKEFFKTTVKNQTDVGKRWFREYWEIYFNCKFSKSSKKKTKKCTTTDKFSQKFEEKKTLYTIRNSVFVFGQVLINIHRDACPGEMKLCPEMKRLLSNGKKVLEYLKRVTDPFNVSFSFVNGSDGPPLYSVLQYQMDKDTTKYRWTNIGNFTEYDGLVLDNGERSDSVKYSVCSEDCKSGEFRKIRDIPCCWDCFPCPKNSIVNITNPTVCLTCREGFVPGLFRNSCEPIPPTFFSISHPFAIVLTFVSGVGVVMCIVILGVFISNKETPIVKASGFISSVLLLVAIILSFITTILIFVPPSIQTCSCVRIFLGLSYTIAYSAVFSKLYMLSSAFNTKRMSINANYKRSSRLSLASKSKVLPFYAFLIALALIFVHLAGLFVWIIIEQPLVVSSYPVIDGHITKIVTCNDALKYSYIMVLLWPFVLMVICVTYAIKLRKLPEGFNEKNKIAYCTTISFILWIVFIPVYAFSLNNNLRVIALSLALFIHGIVFLLTLFLPKVYIVLFRKDKNTKETVLGTRSLSPTPLSHLSNSKRRGSNLSFCHEERPISQSSQLTQAMENGRVDVEVKGDATQNAEDSDNTTVGTLPFKSKAYKRFLSKESTSSSRVNGDLVMTVLKQTIGVNAVDGITNFNSSYGFRPVTQKEDANDDKQQMAPKDSKGFKGGEIKLPQNKKEQKREFGLKSELIIPDLYERNIIMNDFLNGAKYHESLRRKPLGRRHSNSNPDLMSKSRLAALQRIYPVKAN